MGLDPTAAELACVRTHHAEHGQTVYIPGSSLKGVLRSAAEAALRSQKLINGVLGACDPLNHDDCCFARVRERQTALPKRTSLPTPEVHKMHCLACRLFGSLTLKGRASIRDLFPWSVAPADPAKEGPGGSNHRRANHVETRPGVAIDRITGSVRGGALFEQEMIPAGTSFWGELALENYQTWQLGLADQAILEVNNGFAQLGSSKSRGLGVCEIAVEHILHEQVLSDAVQGPAGVGELMTDAEEKSGYGLLPETKIPHADGTPRGLSRRFTLRSLDQIDAWRDAGAAALGGLVCH
ncbi:MAG: RAMP superfamily CRISPR-associated protein [Polyangia bacterium]